MPNEIPQPPKEIQDINAQLPDAGKGTDGFDVKDSEGYNEKLVDAIEMIGEEKAAGYDPAARSQKSKAPACAISTRAERSSSSSPIATARWASTWRSPRCF